MGLIAVGRGKVTTATLGRKTETPEHTPGSVLVDINVMSVCLDNVEITSPVV